jgi:hypothetical protein
LFVQIPSQLIIKILRNAYALPPSCGASLKLLAALMLRPDPAQRPTARDLLRVRPVRDHLEKLSAFLAPPPRVPAPRRRRATAADALACAGASSPRGGGGAGGAAARPRRAASRRASEAAAASPSASPRTGGGGGGGAVASPRAGSPPARRRTVTLGSPGSALGKKIWEEDRHFEKEQRQLAERRYQARLLEQRRAREEVRGRGRGRLQSDSERGGGGG